MSLSSSTNFTLGQNKPLINREQAYVLDRKLLSVHSEDRDITKYPNAHTFEIMLPEPLLNVQSLRLVQATMPHKFYTFTDSYQNTQLAFTVAPGVYEGPPFVAIIQEGTYTPGQLALELAGKMNAAVAAVDDDALIGSVFNVFYDEVSDKLWFGNSGLAFTLECGSQLLYDTPNCGSQPVVWFNWANWGLPYNLGFQKQTYTSTFLAQGVVFDYLCPDAVCPGGAAIINYIQAPLALVIHSDTAIYLEVDKYNNYDEMYPYNQSSRAPLDNYASNGRVNAAFAKIPIQWLSNGSRTGGLDSRTLFLQNIVQYEPPIERIARLKFRFRFHDGRLVDFQNYQFDFSLEFNSLKNEIAKAYQVRVPVAYVL